MLKMPCMMKHKRYHIIVLLLLAGVSLSDAQPYITLKLVDNISGIPVSGAYLFSEQQDNIATSNGAGICRVMADRRDITLKVSHISYMDTTVKINPVTGPFLIRLSPSVHHLNTYSVYAKPVDLIPERPWFVTSYLVCDQGLLLLAFPENRLNRQSLFLLNNQQDVVANTPWKEPANLFRDAAGDIWLRGKDRTCLLEIRDNTFTIGSESILTKEFDAGIARIEAIIKDNYYFGHYRLDNQWLDYYCYNLDQDKTFLFESIADPLGLRLRETRDIFETNEFERRFGEMCFFAPVFAPLVKQGQQIMIFNFAEGVITHFDTLNHPVKRIPFPDYRNRSFRKILLHDPAYGRFYAVFESQGISTLKEIDPVNGSCLREIIIPSFPYIEQLSVHSNNLYFLYRDPYMSDYRKIFRMPL